MADTDDPWANHIRGTPLAEGADPLSNMNGTTRLPDAGKATSSQQQISASAETPVRSATSMHASEDARNEHDEGDDTLRGDEFIYPANTQDDDEMVPALSRVTSVQAQDQGEESDDDEAFVYPGASGQQAQTDIAALQDSTAPGVESSRDPEANASTAVDARNGSADDMIVASPASTSQAARPIDYARLTQLCSNGSVDALKSFFEVTAAPPPVGSGSSAFALANDPHPASGLAPIHIAAKEGRVDILKYLVRETGALIELEDREGETAVHKAALAGKLPALTFLLASGASASSRDGDGWTPLHNACSKGYLDIVKLLVENARAPTDEKGGRGAWTPLMSAASNGHLPVVRYLTMKQRVDPFIRNAAGETAFDVAAATFEIFICEVLERYESERWAALRLSEQDTSDHAEGSQRRGPYNPLALHSIIPVVLHENQRLDTRLSTLAMRGGKPRWSGTQAGRADKPDKRAPGTMPPGPLSLSRSRHIPIARDDVDLPTRSAPYKLRLPTRNEQMAAARRARGENTSSHDEFGSTPTPQSVISSRSNSGVSSQGQGPITLDEPSHFWLSDWQTDYTHPQVDAEEGWQYSPSFETPDERWVAAAPPPLTRMLEGAGLGQSVQRAVNSVAGSASATEAEAVTNGWVRRRRWVRVMRRRLDITFSDELEALEQASLDSATSLSGANAAASALVEEAQQEAQDAVQQIVDEDDYLSRANALAGNLQEHEESQHLLRKHIIRLDLAISELRQHAFSDASTERQQDAEELLKTYTLRLGQIKQQLGVDEESDEDDDDEDADFIYPNSYKDDGQSVVTRLGAPSTGASRLGVRPAVPQRQSSAISVTSGSFGADGTSSSGVARSNDLANAREFRVPTQDVPSRPVPIASSSQSSFGPHGLVEQSLLRTWENDADAPTCRSCGRKFTFFVRKHHCRRCGKIFCDACSTHRAQLSADELIIDPGVPEMLLLESGGPSRICDGCDAERRLPPNLHQNGAGSMSAALGQLENASASRTRPRLSGGSSSDIDDGMSDVSSRASELNECPVCGRALAGVGEDAEAQEEHVRQCLDNGGAGGSVQGGRYLVYKLSEGPIVGKECQICLEELLVGMTIARLPCLCYYHRHCIDSWFSRGRTCPVHARAW